MRGASQGWRVGVFMRDREPKRFRKHRYGPVRLVLPWVSVAVGLFFVLISINFWAHHHDGTANFWIGIGLVVLGIAAFFLYRWMAKKGI